MSPNTELVRYEPLSTRGRRPLSTSALAGLLAAGVLDAVWMLASASVLGSITKGKPAQVTFSVPVGRKQPVLGEFLSTSGFAIFMPTVSGAGSSASTFGEHRTLARGSAAPAVSSAAPLQAVTRYSDSDATAILSRMGQGA